MPFSEFSGSAVALSSFSLPDTQVYLNVFSSSNSQALQISKFWVGIAEDPVRLIQADLEKQHHRVLQEVQNMGKKAQIIFTADPKNFISATEMALLDAQEFKHLQAHVDLMKTGASRFRANLQLCGLLWVKPNQNHQRLRFVAVASGLVSLVFLNWSNQHQLEQQTQTIFQEVRSALKNQGENSQPVPFTSWAEQVKKFGQGNRANLTGIRMSWNKQGQINTHALLERDRKRVPKSCVLTNPTRAECSISGENR